MALEAVTPRQREQRTLPDRTGQRGQRTAAAWSSRAGYTQGPRPRLRGPWALIFAVLGILMLRGVGGSGCGSPLLLTLVKPASAMSVRKDEIPQQSSAPLEGSLQQKLCLPGGFLTTGPARKPSELLLEEKQKKIAVPPPRTLSVSANLALSVEKMHLNSVKNAAPGALMGRSWSRTVTPGATSSVWTKNQVPWPMGRPQFLESWELPLPPQALQGW